MEDVTIVRFARQGEVLYEMQSRGTEWNDRGVILTLEQLEVLAQELPFIVASEKRGGDNTEPEN